MKKLLLVMCLISIVTACGGGGSSEPKPVPTPPATTPPVTYQIKGSAVKGAIAHAKVVVYRVDVNKDQFKGSKVSEGITDNLGLLSEVLITEPLDSVYILELIVGHATIDLNTGRKPYLSKLSTIVSKEDIEVGRFISLTPFTTMALNSVNVGDVDTATELLNNTQEKSSAIIQHFGFGIEADFNVFYTPAAVYEQHLENISSIAAYRKSIEAFAAFIYYIEQSSNLNSDEILRALAADFNDSALDGIIAEKATNVWLQNAPINHLPVPNLTIDSSPVTVANFLETFIDEIKITHPNFDFDKLNIDDALFITKALGGDFDADGWPDTIDSDDDNDNVSDELDAFPLDASDSIDTDLDGIGNNADTDDDNDGVLDTDDIFPLDATESVDNDLDGIGDNADLDDDNDNVSDEIDVFPLDASDSIDTDLDGIGNNADTDDDNDGVLDTDDIFPLDATESVDTDIDGIGDNADLDDDNDNVPDEEDVFPTDKNEYIDTDNDSIGNNADTDDDNDGVLDTDDIFPLDANESADTDFDGVGDNADNYPTDAACSVLSDGNGAVCYLTLLASNNQDISKKTASGDVFFYLESLHKIVEFSLHSGHVINLYNVSDDANVIDIAIDESSGTIYIAYDSNTITYLDAEQNEQPLITLDAQLYKIAAAGNYLIANRYRGFDSIDLQGNIIDDEYHSSPSLKMLWDEGIGLLYYLDQSNSNRRIRVLGVDQETGRIVRDSSSSYFNQDSSFKTIALKQDDNQLIVSSGRSFQGSTFLSTAKIEANFADAIWPSNDLLVTISEDNEQSLVQRYNFDGNKLLEQVSIAGSPVYVGYSNNNYQALTKTSTGYQWHEIVPSDDSDNDGVLNVEDAFAIDNSASIDNDKDGYPDSWNEGSSQHLSTTGLVLDYFPADQTCWSIEHQDAEGLCNYSATMGYFQPSKIFKDNENIYFYHPSVNYIYRWSMTLNKYLKPLKISGFGASTILPTNVWHAPQSDRIYLSYRNHNNLYSVAYIDTNLEDNAELITFVNDLESLQRVTEAGRVVLFHKSSYNTDSYDTNGNYLTTSNVYLNYDQLYWDPIQEQVVITDYSTLGKISVEQFSGEIAVNTQYNYSSGSISHVSADYNNILLADKNIVNSASFINLGQLGNLDSLYQNYGYRDAAWTNEFIVTLDSNHRDLSIWRNDNFAFEAQIELDERYVKAIYSHNGQVFVIRTDYGEISIEKLTIDDFDDDGMPSYWEDQYGLNPYLALDASTDNDLDGLTNLQEYQYGTNPNLADTDGDRLSDNIEINTHGTDPNLADSDLDGLSDGEEILDHNTNANSIDSDNDGLSDFEEITTHNTNPLLADSDNDGLDDLWEITYSTNPLVNDVNSDGDLDNLTLLEELAAGTNPNIADSDGDGINDGDEVKVYFSSPINFDTDGDKLPDGWELSYSFDFISIDNANIDSDDDSFSNYEEYIFASDPLEINSIPVVDTWYTFQGNAKHNGLVPVTTDINNFTLRWSKQIDSPLNELQQIASGDGKVFVTNYAYHSEHALLAINSLNGVELWREEYYRLPALNPPAYHNGQVYIRSNGHDDSYLRSFNSDSGELSFEVSYSDQWSRHYAPTPNDGKIYMPSGYYGGVVEADAHTGIQQWHINDSWESNWTPAVDEEYVYYFDNGLKLANKNTGASVTHINDYDIDGTTPVIGLDKDAYTIYRGDFYAFDLRTKSVKWMLESQFSYTPAVGIDAVYGINNRQLQALNKSNGQLLWSSNLNKYLTNNIVISRELAFVASDTETFALSLTNGQQVWSYPVGGQLSISEGALFIASEDGQLVAINIDGDSDNDGINDWWEDRFGLDKNNVDDAILDLDSDGLTNIEEYTLATDPNVEDTDSDGLSDFEEYTTYRSNPLSNDTDADGMDDLWEVNNGLNLLDATDKDLDADVDSLTNIEEYIEATDPNDPLSLPSIIGDLDVSFEDQLLPSDWSVVSNDGIWSINNAIASDGDYSLQLGNTTQLNISGFFHGNNISIDATALCRYSSNVSISIDGDEVMDIALAEEWQSFDFKVQRGTHTVTIDVDAECGISLDNIVISELQNILLTDTHFVTSYNQKLNFFNYDNELVDTVAIPQIQYDARDLKVLGDGRIVVYNGVFAPGMSIYNPQHHSWTTFHHLGWGTVNNGTYGGIDGFNNYVYVTDMQISGSTSQGVVRFNLSTGLSEHFSGQNNIDLTIGKDNLLYTYDGYNVRSYNPESMAEIKTITTLNGRSISVKANGDIYVATWNGDIYRYDTDGNQLDTLTLSDNNINGSFYDINIDSNGTFLLSNRNGQVIRIDDLLTSFEIVKDNYNADFISIVPLVDEDADGMPLWWENRHGFSDQDANDAVLDLDNDLVVNLDEYLNESDPSLTDSDIDGLSDHLEIVTYLTNPVVADTDEDGLLDGAEVNEHFTNPLLIDSDSDGFSDTSEVLQYETDPNDINSFPEAITSLTESFEDLSYIGLWQEGQESNASWAQSSMRSSAGSYSLKSGDIDDSQKSSVVYSSLMSAGTFSFQAMVSSESCCDKLYFYLDGVQQQIFTNNTSWQSYSIAISSGEHIFEWRYKKDGSVSRDDDAAYIDDISFVQ
ncbi:PQQ-binding-like beta-propeller repeat protein [Thalassotalea psychrophila]|uniref:PQQ-binding-like beta-propeller repeat protein n=1 Tax=Thalassotalea psychrophila TaxID=3065647 RepID=A0ABY9TUG2_9GAMM|nr:PQQ-binding-like beta-propeller repeat protein [Colwelliaceae bacterium SQ149]